jgi:hypothetical protein
MNSRRIATVLVLPLLVAALFLPSGSASAAKDVYVPFGGWGKIEFGMKVKRAARILDRKALDRCGGTPIVSPAPYGLVLGHPMANSGYSMDRVRVTYQGGYAPNIHGPHGIHPGMSLRRALNLMGPDRHRVVGDYVTGWYEMGPRGRRALVIQGYDGTVTQVAVVKNRKIAKRIATNPGC